MAGYSWEGCPAVDGLCGCCRCARARVRRAVPQCTACDELRCERLSGVGLRAAIWRSFESERSWGTAGEEDSSGRRRLLRCRAPLKLVERVAPSAPTTLLRLKQTTQHVVFYSSERAKPAIRWTERYNSASHTLCCDHSAVSAAREALAITQAASVTPENAARSARSNASRASRARKPRRRK